MNSLVLSIEGDFCAAIAHFNKSEKADFIAF